MFDFISSLGLDPNALLASIVIAAVVLYLAYRRYIVAALEPLTMYVLILIADSTLMFALPWNNTDRWKYVGFLFAFWIGFVCRRKARLSKDRIQLKSESVFDLCTILVLLCAIIVAGNLFLGLTAGFPLLSDNPSAAKVTDLTGGLGTIKRLNMGPYLFFCCGCILMAALGHQRRLVLFMLFLATSLVILGGSKSVLLPVVYVMSLVVYHKGMGVGVALQKAARKYTLIALGAAIGIALLVTTKDQGSLMMGVSNLFSRVLLSGDVILYYFPRRDAIIGALDASFFGFVSNLFSDTLGFLRLASYQEALGSIILGNSEGFGPNVQFFIQADLFFNLVGGLIFSCLLGYLVASLRHLYFASRTKSAITLTFQCVLALCAFDLAIESGMFMTEIFTLMLIVMPLWGMARIIRLVLTTIASATSTEPVKSSG
ncbi:MAG: hypothetical protein PW789_10250 [Edaphobacter sp.]|uniref:hypothetical protein n=1 Tax=Edaphobacter sp. TaxID=1934404 RepID=UPI00238E8B9B|nr:hypothetical protein [Edaphobacter sp.]MDE1176973.1 hypothetical protein [Edaphobacter sp.]